MRGPETPIDFRPLTRADFPLLHRWLTAAHVRVWWGDDPPDIEQKYGPRVDNPGPVKVFVILLGGTPVGMIQCHRLDGAVPDAVGIDYLIGDGDRCGRGLGTAVIAAFTQLVFDLSPDISMITADPAPDNHASRRVLEKVGYLPDPAGVIYTFQRPRR